MVLSNGSIPFEWQSMGHFRIPCEYIGKPLPRILVLGNIGSRTNLVPRVLLLYNVQRWVGADVNESDQIFQLVQVGVHRADPLTAVREHRLQKAAKNKLSIMSTLYPW